jgi:hypothetical protein
MGETIMAPTAKTPSDIAPRPPRRRHRRPAREKRARKARRHPGLAACTLPGDTGTYLRGRHAAGARGGDWQAHRVLLRLRRAFRHGGAGGAGFRTEDRLPHSGRHRRLEKGLRPTGVLPECPPGAVQMSSEFTLSAAVRCEDTALVPSSLADTASWRHRQ